jgi:hypothetical protein
MPRKRTAILALLAGTVAAFPATADAQRAPRFSVTVHAIFSGGQSSNFTAGQPLQVSFTDRRHRVHETRICWTPAPVQHPSCSLDTQNAPAAAGSQRVTVRLSNGTSISKTFQVGAAARTIASSASGNVTAVPVALTCATPLLANANTSSPSLGTLPNGQFVAAYYTTSTFTQVWSYASQRAGFVASSCVGQPNGQTSSGQSSNGQSSGGQGS